MTSQTQQQHRRNDVTGSSYLLSVVDERTLLVLSTGMSALFRDCEESLSQDLSSLNLQTSADTLHQSFHGLDITRTDKHDPLDLTTSDDPYFLSDSCVNDLVADFSKKVVIPDVEEVVSLLNRKLKRLAVNSVDRLEIMNQLCRLMRYLSIPGINSQIVACADFLLNVLKIHRHENCDEQLTDCHALLESFTI